MDLLANHPSPKFGSACAAKKLRIKVQRLPVFQVTQKQDTVGRYLNEAFNWLQFTVPRLLVTNKDIKANGKPKGQREMSIFARWGKTTRIRPG